MLPTLQSSRMRHVLFPVWTLHYGDDLQLRLHALKSYHASFPDKPIPDFDRVPATGNITPEAYSRAVLRDLKVSLQSEEKTTFPRLCQLIASTKNEHWTSSRKSVRMFRELIDKTTAMGRALICASEEDQLLSRRSTDNSGYFTCSLMILEYVIPAGPQLHKA